MHLERNGNQLHLHMRPMIQRKYNMNSTDNHNLDNKPPPEHKQRSTVVLFFDMQAVFCIGLSAAQDTPFRTQPIGSIDKQRRVF